MHQADNPGKKRVPPGKMGTVHGGQRHAPRGLSVSGLVLLSVGGIIGAGFFLGAGLPIKLAGPAVIVAYLFGALLTCQVIGALSSLAMNDEEKGSFVAYTAKYVGAYFGFLQGWTYYVSSVLTIASEAVAMSVFTHLWLHFLPNWVMAAIYAAAVIVINAFGMRNFDRIESLMSVVKTAALVMFIGVTVWTVSHLWFTPHVPVASHTAMTAGRRGFFPTGIDGVLQSMLIVIFSYAGIGVFGTAVSEMKRPGDIDKAAFITVAGLTILYTASIALVLLIIPWYQAGTNVSPFVTALERSLIPWSAEVLNLVVLVASFSVMAGAVYSANRILHDLGSSGQAPRFVSRVRANGTPAGALTMTTVAVAVTIGISYLLPANVYNFLISASGFFTFLNWSLILLSFLIWYWRYRTASTGRLSSLTFGRPVSSLITFLCIVVLGGYALMQRDQRLGFVAFALFIGVISGSYMFRRRPRG